MQTFSVLHQQLLSDKLFLDVLSQTNFQDPMEPATNEMSMNQLNKSDACFDL